MSDIKVPKEYHNRKNLMAVPELEYRQFRAFMAGETDELTDVQQSLKEVKAGRVIYAKSADQALKVAHARNRAN